VVAFAFAPLRQRTQRMLDRVFGRDPDALRRALDQAGHELLGALDRGEVRASVERGLSVLKRRVAIEWPVSGAPRLLDPEETPEGARTAIQNLLTQAGVRLENLALQAQRAAAERRVVELREAATRAELRALQAQVQPHFLFNALNALSYLTETDPPAAQRFTERLADMLRYTVEAGERPAALLADEIGFVEDYLGVARERYENALSFEYHGRPELLSTAVPPLLLQPLVENSLKHGCTPGSRALHLKLNARTEDGVMKLEFSDDGMSNGNGGPGLGLGLQNLEQRLRHFAGGNGNARMIAGPRPEGGFSVMLQWPVNHGGIHE
ncbi:MAG TPA: histidine kinase, partial [Planctomycetota bacterium]|nr:histidine kinase [Planctomycetota bacterium]